MTHRGLNNYIFLAQGKRQLSLTQVLKLSLCNQLSSFLIEKIRDMNIEGELSETRKRMVKSGRGKEEKGELRVYEHY